MLSVLMGISILQALFTEQADTVRHVKGWRNKVAFEEANVNRSAPRSRSPRGRQSGARAMLKSWAKGEASAIGVWRLIHAIVDEDGSECGHAMARLSGLASETSGSEQNISKRLIDLLAKTGLTKLIRDIPHEKGKKTVTHHIRPADLIRLIHTHNRRRFVRIFGADKEKLKSFWEGLFSSADGQEFKDLHPALRLKQPEDLKTSIPIVIHEDAAPFQKKRSVNAVQFGPLLGNNSDIETRFVTHGYISKEEQADTASKAWGPLWDDIDTMVEGEDQEGQYIAKEPDGTVWKFVFLFFEQDFDMDTYHGLPNCNQQVHRPERPHALHGPPWSVRKHPGLRHLVPECK